MCSYSLGGALYLYANGEILRTPNGYALTGVERRANRGMDNMARALSLVPKQSEYVHNKLKELVTYSQAVALFNNMEGYGRWASFKLAEILDYCFNLNLYCDTLFTEKGSGHTKGLQELTGLPPTERLAQETFAEYRAVYPEYKYQNFETSLCDWHNLTAGKYYVGNDIDMLKVHLENANVYNDSLYQKLYPNYNTDHAYDPKELRKLYKTNREIIWWK
jgi:hypothetical protein